MSADRRGDRLTLRRIWYDVVLAKPDPREDMSEAEIGVMMRKIGGRKLPEPMNSENTPKEDPTQKPQ